jgi:hypothetical protein
MVSVCDNIDWLRLRSRTESAAREDARLPGLVRIGAALRRERPDRVSGSCIDSSGCGSDGVAGTGADASAESCSVSFSLPLPFALDLRCDFGFDGLAFGVPDGTKSSIGSGMGRGLGIGVPAKLNAFFHKLLAETGVPIALSGERSFNGVEKDCLACVTSACMAGTPGLPVPGVCTLVLLGGCCRLLTGVDTCGWCGVAADCGGTREGSCRDTWNGGSMKPACGGGGGY